MSTTEKSNNIREMIPRWSWKAMYESLHEHFAKNRDPELEVELPVLYPEVRGESPAQKLMRCRRNLEVTEALCEKLKLLHIEADVKVREYLNREQINN